MMKKIPIMPMLCQPSDMSVLEQLNRDWIIEPKLDGERIIAVRKGSKVEMWTRREKEVSEKFPEVVEALLNLESDEWILDGELTVEGGFEKLLTRSTTDRLKIRILSKMLPATYNVFDVMANGEGDLTRTLLRVRKSILSDIVNAHSNRVKQVFWRWNEPPMTIFRQNIEEGYEGIVAKRIDSQYRPDYRSPDWLKFKKKDFVDVEVIGATFSKAGQPFGALILAKDGEYYGKVGSGFTDAERAEILKTIKTAKGKTDIALPSEVRAELLLECKPHPAEISIQENCKNGSPRHPVWIRFRWE